MLRIVAAAALVAVVATPVSAQSSRERLSPESEKQSREGLMAFTACIAENDPAAAGAIVAMDFTQDDFDDEVSEFLRVGRFASGKTEATSECVYSGYKGAAGKRSVSATPLAVTGGLAEALIERDDAPLLNRLAMTSLGGEVTPFAPTDAMAMCMVRGAPDLAAKLFATDVASDGEQEAYRALLPVATMCWGGEQKLEMSAFGMRSMMATASYRLLRDHD
jgi:hypothetical protein